MAIDATLIGPATMRLVEQLERLYPDGTIHKVGIIVEVEPSDERRSRAIGFFTDEQGNVPVHTAVGMMEVVKSHLLYGEPNVT